MHCPRCQHENRPQANFCERCAGPLKEARPVTRSHADDLKAEVESLRRALTEAVEQQKATAELLQTQNRELTEAQEQQAATSEILGVIATSPTNVQPVFDTILDNATRLCEAERGALFLFDGEAYHAAAFRGAASALVSAPRSISAAFWTSWQLMTSGWTKHVAKGRATRARRPGAREATRMSITVVGPAMMTDIRLLPRDGALHPPASRRNSALWVLQ